MHVSGPELLKPAKAAEILGISVSHLWYLARKGRVRSCVTPGGNRRYYAEEIRSMRVRGEAAGDERQMG